MRILMRERDLLRSILPHLKAKDPKLARGAAAILVQLGSAEARVGLLHLLHHADRTVVLAAIQALEAIGTIDEIEHLLPFDRWLADRKLRTAARTAIDAIRARGRGSPGALSLTALDGEGSLGLV